MNPKEVTFSINLNSLVLKSSNKLKEQPDRIKAAILRYKMLLILANKFPKICFSPDVEVDEIFHLHLLRPNFYYKDSINNFGRIINHIPESKKTTNKSFHERIELTKKYWFNFYKEKYPDNIVFAWCGVSGDDDTNGDNDDKR